jgi:predicted Zn-dependent protease
MLRAVVMVAVTTAGVAWADVPLIPSLPGFARSRRQRQSEAAQKLHPAAIELRPYELSSGAVEPRPLRVRVYAARDYRATTMNWSVKFRRLVERVNRTTARWPSVRFEVVEAKSWDRDSAGDTPEQLLVALEQLDPGRDVDVVVGLAVALPLVPSSLHALGFARVPGRHFVMRALHDLAEREALRAYYDELSESERDQYLDERKQHKEQVLFLHEWAHTLGAIHTGNVEYVMNASYDGAMSRFDAANGRLMEQMLKGRSAGEDDAAQVKRLADYLKTTRSNEWDGRDLAEKVAALSGKPLPAHGALPSAAADGKELTEAERAVALKAQEQLKAGDPENAWKTLYALLAKYRRHTAVQSLGCAIAAAHRPQDAEQLRRVELTCAPAIELDRDNPWPPLMLADALVAAHREDRVATSLMQAHQRLDYKSDAGADAWQALAELYTRALMPTRAVEVAPRAGAETVKRVADWEHAYRRGVGLPVGTLDADRERSYGVAHELAREALAGDQKEAAGMLITNLERDFPTVPGAAVLRCSLDGHLRQIAAAKASCARAATAQDDSYEAHFYLALALLASGKTPAAIQHLERARALQPSEDAIWRTLAFAYGKARKRAALDELRAGYARQFGHALE